MQIFGSLQFLNDCVHTCKVKFRTVSWSYTVFSPFEAPAHFWRLSNRKSGKFQRKWSFRQMENQRTSINNLFTQLYQRYRQICFKTCLLLINKERRLGRYADIKTDTMERERRLLRLTYFDNNMLNIDII